MMLPPNRPCTTRILPYGPAAIAEAARLIAAGEPVSVATETVYGLAADATDPVAVARIYAAKGRPRFNPLIVHVPDLAVAESIALFGPDARKLADAFWPGPLTLVLPLRASSGIASLVTAGLETVAVRVPAHRAMRALLEATGRPLAAPSANVSGGISPTRAEHVRASLGGRVTLVIDDGATQAGLESTIVMGREVLRQGPVTEAMLAPYFHPGEGPGPVTAQPGAGSRPSPGGNEVVAPGQLASHYAPSKPLRLEATEAEADEYLIGFGPVAGTETLSVTGDLTEAAANLFDALHRADASRASRIAVASIPFEGVGAAINDRLARAAH